MFIFDMAAIFYLPKTKSHKVLISKLMRLNNLFGLNKSYEITLCISGTSSALVATILIFCRDYSVPHHLRSVTVMQNDSLHGNS